jgi:aspartyl-tRNA(Asn)/glutamyl-tRNA(Gln) amidotransferase subunit C
MTCDGGFHLDPKVVKHIAGLARLALNDEQVQDYSEKLSQVLGHFEKMSTIPTDQVEPLLTPTEIETFLRVDEVQQTVSTEDLLSNAPSSQGHLFKVPPVVGS